VAITGLAVVFNAVKAGIVFEVPVAASPILVVLFAQAYVVDVPPVLFVLKVTNPVLAPLQTT
jgi:hypothetical protein